MSLIDFLTRPHSRQSQVTIPSVKPKQRNPYGYYKMTCPFCLKEFDVWEMPFRAYADLKTTANTGNTMATPAQPSAPAGSSMDRTTFGQAAPVPPAPKKEESTGANVHFFPPEEDEKHENFLREMEITASHNVYKGKVLTVFEEGANGAFNCEGIEAVKLFGSDSWIQATPANAQALSHKAVAKIRDKYGKESEERLCPHCHNPMPDKAGQLPSYVIMILGDTNSGKSVYKIRMLRELDQNGMLNGTVSAGQFYSKNATDGSATSDISALWWDTFENAYRKKKAKIIGNTKVEYINPYTVTLCRDGREVALLTIYDFPGEAIRYRRDDPQHKDYVARTKERIDKVDGLMFLLDMTAVDFMSRNLADEYKSKPDNNEEFTPWTPERVLGSFLNNYLTVDMGSNVTVPICYMFSKADLLKMAIAECRNSTDPWASVGEILYNLCYLSNPPASVTNRLDLYRETALPHLHTAQEMRSAVREYDAAHTLVDMDNILLSDRELTCMFDSELRRALRVSPKGLAFAVSSVGAPISTEDECLEEADPIRVMEPLEYLLWQMGLVECQQPESEENRKRLAELRK